MSPEQANGLEVDARSDLFSLGTVLYHAATGTQPFTRETFTATLAAVGGHTPRPAHEANPAVPRELSDFIGRLMNKTPADRPATAREVADELARFEAMPLRAGGRGPGARWWVWGAVAAVLLLGVGFAAWRLTRADPPTPETATPPGPPATAPTGYKGSIDLLVYRTDDAGRDILVPLSDPRSMPLKPGDQMKFVAELDRPAFLYVFWIDETGTTHPAYPWRLTEWGSRPAVEEPVARQDIRWPNGAAVEITGDTAGTETVLMLARPTPLEATDEQVKQWFAGLKPVPFKGEKARVWFENFDLLVGDPLRAPGMADRDGAGDGPLALQKTLRQRIGDRAAYSRAISFSRLGKQGGK
jgi:hypothetical protein